MVSIVSLVGVSLLLSPAAGSELRKEKHYVLEVRASGDPDVKGPEVFVDLGVVHGVVPGLRLTVHKTGVTLKHPVTGEDLTGTIYMGELKVVEVSDHFSIALPVGKQKEPTERGFEVRLREDDISKLMASGDAPPPLLETWRGMEPPEGAFPDIELRRYWGNNNRIRHWAEVVYFQNDGSGREDARDYWTRFETDFLYRTFWRQIHSIAFGIAGIKGEGLFVDDPGGEFDHKPCRDPVEQNCISGEVGYYYGYTEFEVRIQRNLSVIPQFQLGLANEGIGYGVAGKVRVGPEIGTNLVIGGNAAKEIGSVLSLEFNHWVSNRVSLTGAVAWENLVNGGFRDDARDDVRVIVGTHWAVNRVVTIDGRVGWGGREIEHLGPTLGLGLSWNFSTPRWWEAGTLDEIKGASP